jgi:hypothetical protein
MKTCMLTIAFTTLLASGCTLFGTKLVSADYEATGEPPGRSSEEMSQCFESAGVGREGLNVADKNVLYMACGDDMYGSSSASSRIDVEELIYSEVDIDPVYHGIHLILCSMDAKMEKYYHIMEKCRLSYELAHPEAFKSGLAGYPGVDALGREILLYRYNQAALKVVEESQKWAEDPNFNPRESQIFYDVPHRVLEQYMKERAEFQDIYNAISAFRAHFAYQPFGASVPADCEQTLTSARAEYLARSDPTRQNAWDLMSQGLGYWITENLVLCHLGQKDYAGALAEAQILMAERREVSVFEKIYSAVAAEIVKDNEMESKLKANIGEAKGLVMPYKPTTCHLDCLTKPGKMFAHGRPDWEEQIRVLYPSVSVIRGVIKSIADNGKIATIKWQGDPVSWASWACYDTNAIDYITEDGYVVYRRQCFKNLEMVMDRPPSATLPVAETEGLQKGQMAAVVQDSLDAQNSTIIFGCWDKGEGKKICSRVEEILFQ